MDQIDINARKAASEMQKNAVSGKAKSEKVVKSPAINIHATASYIKALQTSQDNLPESLNKGLNTLKNNLSIYLNAPDKIEDVPVDSTRESMSTFNKLSLQVISRDSALQEKVAQNLSTSKRLVRARDAQKSLEQSLNSMPQALKEGTGVGRSLSKFVCECLVNLTDPQTIGAGLERDLAMRQIFIPQDRLNSRSASAVSKSLEQSIAFIESNQKDVIARLPKNEYVQEKPGATTPQTMTRYLRKALDEFPDDSTYLDIFKQNRDRTDNAPYDDKVSEEISSRIHSLIAKAAQTARRGNLIPNSRKNAESTPVPTEQVRAQERTFNRPIQSDAPIDENVSARELSLSELSARAARLQKQFRQERMRLVQEGKLPNPATPPESFTVNTTAKEVLSKTLSEPGPAEKLQTARDLALQRAIVDTSAKAPNVADDMAADIKNTVSAQKPAVTADEAHVSTPSEQAKAVAEKTLMQQGTMLDKGVKISYTAAQNNLYGAINMAPGETIAIQTPNLETPAVKGPVEPQSTVEPTKQEPLSPKSLVDEITAQLKKQLADDIVKTIEMKTSNLSEKLDDIKATAEELKNKAQNQESKLTSLEKGLIENSAAIDEAKKQAEEISKEQAKALHDIQSKALEAKQNASVSLQSTADYGRYNFTTSQNTSSILEQKLYSGVNTASAPVHNEKALEPEQNVNTTKSAPQPTDEIYEDQTQEVKPQNKVPVQTTDDTVETDAEEIKPQNKVPVQTADEPADVEAEEVKPQNKVPVQATDDTVETDAEEIKPQNKVPVQTTEESAEVEAEEVKPQNKVPVQATDDTVETDAKEIKPQNKVPVQTTEEPAEVEAEEVKPQNKVPVQATDDTVETDAKEIKPQNKVPVQTSEEPVEVETEEVKPQNKAPVQATDDTVETDAEEIKPQNKVPVQTADEPADVEAEEVKPQNKAPVQTSEEPAEVEAEEIKPQNKAPVQTTDEPAEVEAEEVKPQNKAPVQTSEEPVEVEAEEVKPQNKAPAQTTEEPVEVETEEVKPQISTPIQNADELDADDLNGKFAINNDFVDRDIDYDNISTAMPNAQALNSTLITDLENAQGADADNISKLYQYVKPEATDLDLFESQPNKGQSGTAQSTDDGSESVNKPSDIISKVLSQTVPSDDFNDEHNVTLQAIKSEKDIIADITAKSPSIENAEIDDKLNISGRKEAVLNNLVTPPGASVVTTGNSNPIPEQTHIDSMQPVKEGGFFKRIMARFKSGRADEIKDNTAEIKTDNSISTPTVTGKDGQYVLKANPLDQMMYTLRLQSGNPNLPPEFKEEAQKLLNALNNPVDDLISVKNWLNFVTGPISPNSSQALAMHQWAFYILCLRYQQLGKDVHKFLKKSMSSQDIASLMQSLPAIKKDKVLEGPSISMLEETFGQIERLQQQNSNNNNINPLLNRYIPLPPNYDGGREGGFTLKKEKDEDGENTWHLNFAFDLKDLGPIEIKAVAKLPEIKLSFVTENLHAMQKVQELMPDLNYNLQCIGITARTSSMRLGRVSLKESTIAKNPQAPRNDGSTVSVDI